MGERGPATPAAARQKPPLSTVRVAGFDGAVDMELLQLYFEAPRRSGGGDIVSIEDCRDQGYVLVTFDDAAAAARVVGRPHTVSGQPLTVTLYEQPPAVPEPPAPGDPASTVRVTGGPVVLDRDMMDLYFSNNRKSGGGDIAKIDVLEEEEAVLITFTDRRVAKAVIDRKHIVRGTALTVEHYIKTARDPVTKILVQGLVPKACDEDLLQLFFEKEGGGDVIQVQLDGSRGEALITFKEASSAQRVMEKTNLRVGGGAVTVRAYTAEDRVHGEKELAQAGLTTVCVRGLARTTSRDHITNYFENVRRSGGGDVIEVVTNTKDGVFYITFAHAGDAARVCGRQHKVDGMELSVALYKPPAMYKDRLLIKNIPEINSAAPLQMFVETGLDRAGMGDVELQKILFSDDEGCAVVVFNKDIGDCGRIQAYFNQKLFQKCQLVLEQVPVSTTVIVRGLKAVPPVSADTLQVYFANKQYSDGGDVIGVELLPNHQSALVTFADAGVAARVAGKQHSIGRQPVKVSVYIECLGISGGHEEPTVPLPSPMILDNRDLEMLDRLLLLPAGLEHLQRDLQKCYGRLELNKLAHAASVICTVSSKVPGAKQLVKVWADNVRQVLNSHWKAIHNHELTLTLEEFREVEGMLREVVAESNGNIGHHFNAAVCRLNLVCRGSQDGPRIKKLMTDLKQAQAGLERKKNEVTEIIKQQSAMLLMLQKHADVKSLRGKYPLLKINICPDQGCVELRGLYGEIQEAKGKLESIFSQIYVSEYTWETDLHKQLMRKDIARQMVLQKCLEVASNDVLVDLTSEGLTAVSLDAERAEMVQTTARRLIQRRVIRFPENAIQAVKSLSWEQAKAQILKEADNALVMQQDAKTLTIVSVHENIQKYYERLKGFL